ncbi:MULTISPECIES: MotA/TolQ/ExbB proton channel family protein [unclassified Bradyrhizobium]|nr:MULTISPECIES: MotA/TolQ/ExbB proton channel family protein [unclassified Bradyrhizobium]
MGLNEMPRVRRNGRRLLSGLLLGAMATLMLSATPAKAWWNDEWQMRKKITVDASASGANITDQIGTTPVLVRLHVGNFRFASAKEDGSDLRFVAGDDKTPLKHHIEKYDSLLGEALVWVAVPNVQSGAKTDIWAYYGNKKAVATADAKGTYDPDQQLVYHFSERGTPALDSSVWANNAQSVGQPADGSLIGNGLRLDGRTGLTLPASSSLAQAAGGAFTWSAWIKPAALQPNAAIYSRRDGANAVVIGLDNGAPFAEVTNAGTVQRSGAGAPVAPGSWHHLAVIANSAQVTIYLDGAAYASLSAALPALTTIALIGADSAGAPVAAATTPSAATQTEAPAASAADGGAAAPAPAEAAAPVAAMAGFVGDIDELQISKIARPAGFIKFAAVGQGPDQAKLISFSVDEETASWLSGYFAVILKSVTLDGWVVIGILLIMAVISWVVMVDRASYLNKQARANNQFMKGFREIAADLTMMDRGDADEVSSLGGRLSDADAKMMKASSLYRIYHIGAAEIRHRFAQYGTPNPVLSATSIAAIRAALDSGVVKEMQRLNRMMVVLTIAISGGPFLGLLGTVVGVMITFAAIAASGDVNVNAIAPGIAAALVATVAGLGVAIPALFGYNYLISRIKDLSSDIQVFVDEFVTKMAEFYSADRPDPQHRIAAE